MEETNDTNVSASQEEAPHNVASGETPDNVAQVSSDKGDETPPEKETEQKPWWKQVYGEKYSSEDEALKATDNLKKLVGEETVAEQRKRAKTYENLVKKVAEARNISIEDADYLLNNLESIQQQFPADNATPNPIDDIRVRRIESETSKLKEDYQLDKLEAKNQESSEYREQLRLLWRSGEICPETGVPYNTMPLTEVWEHSFGKAFRKGKDAGQSTLKTKEANSISTGKGITTSATQSSKLSKLLETAQDTDRQDDWVNYYKARKEALKK